jgi:hypothetical protein
MSIIADRQAQIYVEKGKYWRSEDMGVDHIRNWLFGCTALLMLSACDGGGTTGVLNFPSPPPPTPTPTPTPAPTPATTTAPAPFGLKATQQFVTFGVLSPSNAGAYALQPTDADAIKFSWSAEANAYLMTLPGFPPSKLSLTFPGNNPLAFYGTDADGNRLPLAITLWTSDIVGLNLSYSSLGFYSTYPSDAMKPYLYSTFAYGVPTAEGDVPKVGTATYGAKVYGITTSGNGYDITGDAQLVFDFGAGSLSGFMRPRLFSDWDGVDRALPQYDFKQTIYSPGSNTFGGKFNVPDAPTDSAFQGRFTGPGAAELIAGFRAPYLDPFDNSWKTMAGVWLGKKH